MNNNLNFELNFQGKDLKFDIVQILIYKQELLKNLTLIKNDDYSNFYMFTICTLLRFLKKVYACKFTLPAFHL